MLNLFRVLSKLPLRWLHALGSLAGWLTYWGSPTYRRRFQANVQIAGLPWSTAKGAIAHAGRMILETPWLWMRPPGQALGPVLTWDGAELIDAALQQGRGLVLLTPHLGCFEICAQAFADRYSGQLVAGEEAVNPITVLFRPARQPWLREVVDASRERPGLFTAPANLAGVRQMLRALRRGQTIGLLPDQVPPQGLGVWAPFFGQPAYTMTMAGKLLQQTGAAALLIWGDRLPQGRGFVVHVRPAPQIAADSAPESAAAIINKAMEEMIRLAPAQYLWGYHRYKQPRGLDIGTAPAPASADAAAATDPAGKA
ncbi:lysophospholipid acyltransferase family protein [Roseateles koreensis]|uniref:Lysophospholipid acyltransferase family protein n=1 Tax=Roseateles koreensis TaxID=2987526 RepID=A0ABT5KP40_9BURK|nr:lysophospholipid acyltransferase family protein [Roseateles koreensis]MDC8784632.1 lysophospholipid acyltransferase family protein [Roseateles koreensis]